MRAGVAQAKAIAYFLRDGMFDADLGAKRGGQPGAVQGFGARVDVVGPGHYARQARAQ